MNVFAVNDLEAADALALARLDDDGAPPAVTPPPARQQRPGASRGPGRPRDSGSCRAGTGMSRGARSRPEMTDDSRLARARERFLTAEPIERSTPATRPRSSAMQPGRWAPATQLWWMSSAHRGQGADALPPPARDGQAAARWRRGESEADRVGQPGSGGVGDRLAGAQVRARPWWAPARCGCADAVRWRRPAPRASGSRWRASREPASWRCCGLSTGAAIRPARCTCWTPPAPVITTGWCGRSAPPRPQRHQGVGQFCR